jgi:hypothetical protein
MTQPTAATAGPALAWARRQSEGLLLRVGVTPGRLRLAAVLLGVGALLFGVLAAGAAGTRNQAAGSVAKQTEPLLGEAQGLYVSLSDSDATAATTFLTGGLEPPARRERYAKDLRVAAGELTTLTREVGASAQAGAAVRLLTQQLPVYSGLIETARANNRQGFPVGAAYLREASTLMRERILPAARRLYEVEARRLNSDYGSGASTGTFLVVILAAFAMLGLLAGAQVYVTRLTHRALNVFMIAGTVVLVALTTWMVVSFLTEQNSLASAQRTGSDPVEVLAAARILALRAQDDENLALASHEGPAQAVDQNTPRGSGEQDLADFNTVIGRLGRRLGSPRPICQDRGGQRPCTNGSGGLLGEAAVIASRSGSSTAMAKLGTIYAQYLKVHRQVLVLERNGKFAGAVKLAVSSEVRLADALDSGLERQIGAAQGRFASAADAAMSALGGLWLAIPLLTVAFAALALYGLLQRINEYR